MSRVQHIAIAGCSLSNVQSMRSRSIQLAFAPAFDLYHYSKQEKLHCVCYKPSHSRFDLHACGNSKFLNRSSARIVVRIRRVLQISKFPCFCNINRERAAIDAANHLVVQILFISGFRIMVRAKIDWLDHAIWQKLIQINYQSSLRWPVSKLTCFVVTGPSPSTVRLPASICVCPASATR